MNLDQLRFKKLENGYTVKYHVVTMEPPLSNPDPRKPNGFSGEIYVCDINQLKACVMMLIEKNLDPDEKP